VSENRKLKVQPPPEGFVWIEDYRSDDGVVLLPGIARRLGISSSTYRKWRMRGEGPPTLMIGKKVAARIQTIEAYLCDLEQAAIVAAKRAAATAAHDMRPAESRYASAA
jgi:transposase-like protein